MDHAELARERVRNYRGDVTQCNTVEELIRLRESGFLEGGVADGTPRDWTMEESAAIKTAYRYGEHVDEIRRWFPAEADEADDLIKELAEFKRGES